MVTLYENMGTIVGFSILVLLLQNFVGDKASETLVLVVLVSVLLFNADRLRNFLQFN